MTELQPKDLLSQLPTYVDLRKTSRRRKPYDLVVFDDVAVYYRGEMKTREQALDKAEEVIRKVVEAKGIEL